MLLLSEQEATLSWHLCSRPGHDLKLLRASRRHFTPPGVLAGIAPVSRGVPCRARRPLGCRRRHGTRPASG
eukprot:12581113-Alexandrium_andersonii.AAC.1